MFYHTLWPWVYTLVNVLPTQVETSMFTHGLCLYMWITLAQFKYVCMQIKSITFFLCEYIIYYWHAWYIFIMVVTSIFIIMMEKWCSNEKKTSHCKLMNVNWLAHQSLSSNFKISIGEWIYWNEYIWLLYPIIDGVKIELNI